MWVKLVFQIWHFPNDRPPESDLVLTEERDLTPPTWCVSLGESTDLLSNSSPCQFGRALWVVSLLGEVIWHS